MALGKNHKERAVGQKPRILKSGMKSDAANLFAFSYKFSDIFSQSFLPVGNSFELLLLPLLAFKAYKPAFATDGTNR